MFFPERIDSISRVHKGLTTLSLLGDGYIYCTKGKGWPSMHSVRRVKPADIGEDKVHKGLIIGQACRG